jgi:4-aminobutyrate aminotransferase-like enzyme
MRAACLRRGSFDVMQTRPAADELLERRRRVLGPALAPLSYDRPLYLVRGQGTVMFDERGVAYLDAYNNVPVVGHCHPRVTAAISEQSSTLNTNTRYLHEIIVELAERLVATMPDGLDTVMFVNSGSEANDIAWRLATAYTGERGAIVTGHAYHGVTTATIALSPEEWTEENGPLHVATVPAPDDYRGPHRNDDPGWVDRYVAYLDVALDELHRRGVRLAAFFVDSLFTSDGIFTPPPSYLQNIVGRVHDAGGLVVADEVQGGFGRSGSHMWSFERSLITPDFVTLGKPMGNGHPIAAIVTRSEIAERFAAKSDVFSTFGGNPVACRAALAVLDVVRDEALQHHAAVVGAGLRTSLEGLMHRHHVIGDVRGAGLMIGVELVLDKSTREPAPGMAHGVVNRMRDHGVLIGTTGRDGNVLKIRPPLVLSAEEAGVIGSTLDACLGLS